MGKNEAVRGSQESKQKVDEAMADLLFGKNLRKAREREPHFWNQRMKK